MNTTHFLIWLPIYTAAAIYVGWTFCRWRMLARFDCDEASLKRQSRMTYSELCHKYSELLYHVGSKYPGETRHQTALRYIQQAENRSIDGCAGDAACEKN